MGQAKQGGRMMTQAYPEGLASRLEKGGFTLPGEAGYEALTLALAEKWGADVIRDSDGTKLSPVIVEAGYRIYSTIRIIREHNAFAEAHPDAQQQTFLISDAVLAEGERVTIDPLAGYFDQQFQLNDSQKRLNTGRSGIEPPVSRLPGSAGAMPAARSPSTAARRGTATRHPSCAGASGKKSTWTTTPPITGPARIFGSWTRVTRWPGRICKSDWRTGARPIPRPTWCG